MLPRNGNERLCILSQSEAQAFLANDANTQAGRDAGKHTQAAKDAGKQAGREGATPWCLA